MAAVALLGSGGREHALAWRLGQDPDCPPIHALPGNPGVAEAAECVTVNPADPEAVRKYCQGAGVDFAIIGPEDPLAAGVADTLREAGISVLGPSKKAAQLEADKWFAKELMRQASVPTGEARSFTRAEAAEDYVRMRGAPIVIKAVGLAKGKGVAVCYREADAMAAIDAMLRRGEFGDAGGRIIVEELLRGPEVSVLALVSGRDIYVFDPCQDHKPAEDGDTGPMTGGMGAYCPTPLLTPKLLTRVEQDILIPTLDALARDGIEYQGILYAGLMLTEGGPKVLEFNVRFGDPECQPLMMRAQKGLYATLRAAAENRLAEADVPLVMDPRPAVCVVAASRGYPGKHTTGHRITGIADAETLDDVKIFHAGTASDAGHLVTAGGRVLGITALGDTLAAARHNAYAAVEKVHFEGMTTRTDIANRPELRGAG
jgi:phosphoribosylamine--glycine ligase